MASTHHLDAETERAARIFLARLARQCNVAGAIVFGSRARGDARPESDADVAVLLRGKWGVSLPVRPA